jgi:streptogramin lyase
VSVYTNSRGEYSFPGWSDVAPGTHTVSIELPEFEPVKRDAVLLSAGNTAKLDFNLQLRQPRVSEAAIAEIVMGLPGTDEQKFLLAQCGHCHSLLWALRNPHTKDEWLQIVRRMAGATRSVTDRPGTRSFDQPRYIEPLANYLASIRGPGSSDQIPFRLRPRPASDASTRIVVTEYDLPRGGQRELYMIRGDRRFLWAHDVITNEKYAYYSDHFSNFLGRLDKKTGEVKEFRYEKPGRPDAPDPATAPRAGMGGRSEGTQGVDFDHEGNILIAGLRFDTRTEQFSPWSPVEGGVIGVAPDGKVWTFQGRSGALRMYDPKNGENKSYQVPPAPPEGYIYGTWVDDQGRPVFMGWGLSLVRVFDPKTEKHTDYPVVTPQSGPRRGDSGADGRSWFGEYFGGRLGMIDPTKGEIKDFPLVPDAKPFGAPFAMPYAAAVDDKNQLVWATDFSSSRIFRFDMKTEKTTEYLMPLPYEVRHLWVSETDERPTLWIPSYRPPSQLVKVQTY